MQSGLTEWTLDNLVRPMKMDDDITEVRLVYERCHKIDVHDNLGDTPLRKVCKNGHSIILENLTLARANETIKNDVWEVSTSDC